jgi:hypothetical protein
MIAIFVLGSAIGLGAGWWLSQKWYAAELRLAVEQRLRLTDLLAEATALNARYRAMLEEPKPTSQVESPVPISPATSTTKNLNVKTSFNSPLA